LSLMDYWPVLALLGILALWGAIAIAPWYALLIIRRGRVRLWGMAVAIAAGIAGGALTPALGGKDAFGFGVSLLAALAASAATMVVLARWSQMHTDESEEPAGQREGA
jgi:hypothetical protein